MAGSGVPDYGHQTRGFPIAPGAPHPTGPKMGTLYVRKDSHFARRGGGGGRHSPSRARFERWCAIGRADNRAHPTSGGVQARRRDAAQDRARGGVGTWPGDHLISTHRLVDAAEVPAGRLTSWSAPPSKEAARSTALSSSARGLRTWPTATCSSGPASRPPGRSPRARFAVRSRAAQPRTRAPAGHSPPPRACRLEGACRLPTRSASFRSV